MRVLFNSPDEFIDELRATKEAGPALVPSVVRTSLLRVYSGGSIPFLKVVATARTETGEVLRLEAPIGEVWGDEFPSDHETREKAEKITRHIEFDAKDLGYEVRHGIAE